MYDHLAALPAVPACCETAGCSCCRSAGAPRATRHLVAVGGGQVDCSFLEHLAGVVGVGMVDVGGMRPACLGVVSGVVARELCFEPHIRQTWKICHDLLKVS